MFDCISVLKHRELGRNCSITDTGSRLGGVGWVGCLPFNDALVKTLLLLPLKPSRVTPAVSRHQKNKNQMFFSDVSLMNIYKPSTDTGVFHSHGFVGFVHAGQLNCILFFLLLFCCFIFWENFRFLMAALYRWGHLVPSL